MNTNQNREKNSFARLYLVLGLFARHELVMIMRALKETVLFNDQALTADKQQKSGFLCFCTHVEDAINALYHLRLRFISPSAEERSIDRQPEDAHHLQVIWYFLEAKYCSDEGVTNSQFEKYMALLIRYGEKDSDFTQVRDSAIHRGPALYFADGF